MPLKNQKYQPAQFSVRDRLGGVCLRPYATQADHVVSLPELTTPARLNPDLWYEEEVWGDLRSKLSLEGGITTRNQLHSNTTRQKTQTYRATNRRDREREYTHPEVAGRWRSKGQRHRWGGKGKERYTLPPAQIAQAPNYKLRHRLASASVVVPVRHQQREKEEKESSQPQTRGEGPVSFTEIGQSLTVMRPGSSPHQLAREQVLSGDVFLKGPPPATDKEAGGVPQEGGGSMASLAMTGA